LNKTIIYTEKRQKYFSGKIDNDIDFDFDNKIKSTEELKNQKSLLDSLYGSVPFNAPIQGEIYNLTYVGQNSESLMFEGGFKDYVRVDNKPSELKYLKSLNVGDNIDLLIYKVNNRDFIIEGSIAQLYETRAHDTIKSLKEEDSIIALIKELTPAGYNVELQYDTIILPGFMPNTLAGINKLFNPESIVGKSLSVMIESYSREEGTYIVSRRKYLQTLIPEAIKELKLNTVYTGYVTGTTDFGVFVEFSSKKDSDICLTGLIHKTNIDPDWQDKLKQIPSGFEIEFYVKEIIKDSKIILTQILKETLWDTIRIGQTITGIVKDSKQFGVLLWLDDCRETIGLIHNSELEKVNKTFNEGQSVKVKVIAVERSNRKIYLSVA
jgi:ribosomal protein S1